MSHQSSWNKSVFEVYQDLSIDLKWTDELKKTCDDAGVTFLLHHILSNWLILLTNTFQLTRSDLEI